MRPSRKGKDKGKKLKKKSIPKRHHRYSVKKVMLSDLNKPSGVKENPFIVKNRLISKDVSSLIIGIQQPIIELLGLDKDTWYKQWCDPVTKTIFLEVYQKE